MANTSIDKVVSIFLIVCIVLAVALELYKWYYGSQSSGYLFTDTKSTFNPETYEQTNPHLMVTSRNEDFGQEFSYSFWLLIRNNVKKGDNTKHIVISRGRPSPNAGNPVVFLGGESETLQNMTIRVQTYPFQDPERSTNDINHLECVVEDLPLRRWFHVCLCGRNNALDVFVNGRLAQHVEAPQPLQSSTGPLYMNQNGGFDGFISKLHYGNYYYTYDQMYSMLKDGPAPIPDLNNQYGTDVANVGGSGGGLPDHWWGDQRAE